MDKLEIERRIRACLRHVVGETASHIPHELPIRDAVASFDSLAAMEFVTALEDEFGIEVDFVLHDVRFRMQTIQRSVGFVQELLEDKEVLGA